MEENQVLTRSKAFFYYEKYMFVMGILGQILFFSQGFKIFLTRCANDVSLIGFYWD